ncbi:MAG: bacteriohemerythrin [Rhodospirillales bacterium]|nr:bacteriohemerythrin [Rhodospirillales bacterium]
MTIKWAQDFETGIPVIDNDHHIIVDLINKVFDIIAGRADRHGLVEVVDKLMLYIWEHFEREEDLMRQAGYPDLSDHQANHEALMQRVETLGRNFLQDSSNIDPDTLVTLLSDWLVNHILNYDQAFVPCVMAWRAKTETV